MSSVSKSHGLRRSVLPGLSVTFILPYQRSCSGVAYSGKAFLRHTPKASQQPAPTTPAPLQWPEMPSEASVDPKQQVWDVSGTFRLRSANLLLSEFLKGC